MREQPAENVTGGDGVPAVVATAKAYVRRLSRAAAPLFVGPWAESVRPYALLIALPLVMLLFAPNWIFPRPDTVDPWMYVGFFLQPRHHLAQFPHAYHGSRLPILLPGISAYQLLPVVGATIALHLAQYYASVFCLFLTIRRLAGGRAALLGTVLFGTNGMFLAAMGEGFADGFGIPYFLFTALGLTWAATSERWRRWSVVAGVGAALFFFTNIGYGVFAPVLPWYLFALCGYRTRPTLARCGYAAVGFLAATAVMCLENLLLCGRPWFFMPSVVASKHLLANSTSCTGGRFSWVLHAGWLVTPLLVAGCGVVAWRRGWLSRPGSSPAAVPLVAGLAGLLTLLAGLEAGRIIHFLQYTFYCNMVLPVTFLAAGALLAGWLGRLTGGEYWVAVLTAAGVGVVAGTGGVGGGLSPTALLLAPAAVAVVAVWCAARPDLLARHPAAWAVALLGVGNFLVGSGYERFLTNSPLERAHSRTDQMVGRWHDPMPGVRTEAPRPSRAQILRATAEALELAVAHDAHHDLLVWYDVSEPEGVFGNTVASTLMWDMRMVSMHFPAPVNHQGTPPWLWRPGSKLAVISAPGRDVQAEAGPVFYPIGWKLVPLAVHPFEHRGVPAKMTVFQIQPR